MTINPACLERGEDLGRRGRPIGPHEPDLADVRGLAPVHEVLLELEPAVVRSQFRADLVVGHRQDGGGEPEAAAQLQRDLGRPATATQLIRPPQVGRQVPVAEAEPGLLAQLGEAVHHRPRLVREAPAPFGVIQAGQRVGDRVVVRPDREAVQHQVVAGVDDDGQI